VRHRPCDLLRISGGPPGRSHRLNCLLARLLPTPTTIAEAAMR